MNCDIALRPATGSDWGAVASLLEENDLPLDGARERLSDFLLAISGRIVVGCAGVEVYGELALLRSAAVAPTRQRQGIGARLITRLLEDAKRRRIETVYLLTTSAEDYFAKFGFLREPIERAPRKLRESALFQGACPATAALMSLSVAS